MIRLHPTPDVKYDCPYCQVRLEVKGWYIPGMRNLADLECPQCKRAFYGDLPAGHGLCYPMLIEQSTGIVHNKYGYNFFANWLRESYPNRTDTPVDFSIEELQEIKHPVLLNCLDKLYGHCLLKLLNAQYYLDHCPDFDLIVLVPRFLRWMVPEGVAEIWTVDLPLERGIEWNDWLAAEIKRQIEPLGECWLSVAFSHPHPEDYNIERFTGVKSFPVDEWADRLDTPVVTYIWREDRLWRDVNRDQRPQGLIQRMRSRLGFKHFPAPREDQAQRVIALADALHHSLPTVDFAIAGLGHPGGMPEWITDLRTQQIDEHTERAWCERYAKSHVVVGVHGSNMLLPSAHVGGVVELVPDSRWGNLIQDILPIPDDVRESIYRYRFLPLNTPPETVAQTVVSLVEEFPTEMLNFKRPWNDHQMVKNDPWLVSKTQCRLTHQMRYKVL